MCSFLEEASIMSTFEHPNVLSLIGVALDHQEKPYVVLPFMENGDLKTFVSSSSKASDSSILMKKRNYVYSFKVGQSSKKLTDRQLTLSISTFYMVCIHGTCAPMAKVSYFPHPWSPHSLNCVTLSGHPFHILVSYNTLTSSRPVFRKINCASKAAAC